MVSCFSVSAYAAENNPMPEVEATEAQDVGMQSLTMDEAEVMLSQKFNDLENLSNTNRLTIRFLAFRKVHLMQEKIGQLMIQYLLVMVH